LRQQLLPFLETPPDQGTARNLNSILHDLEQHALETSSEVKRIVEAILPRQFRPAILRAIGKLGVDMIVGHDPDSEFSVWPLEYRASDRMEIRYEELERFGLSAENHVRTDALTRLRESATGTAAKAVNKAINDVTVVHWL
jgi:hypothetical protein